MSVTRRASSANTAANCSKTWVHLQLQVSHGAQAQDQVWRQCHNFQAALCARLLCQKESSPEEVLANLTALDHISFWTLATSKEICKSWTAQGLSMPKSDQGIRAMVMSYEKKKEEVCNQLSAMKAEGKKFSLSLDEWTLTCNRRYMSIFILEKSAITLEWCRAQQRFHNIHFQPPTSQGFSASWSWQHLGQRLCQRQTSMLGTMQQLGEHLVTTCLLLILLMSLTSHSGKFVT